MYYNVAQLLKEPVGSTRTYRTDERVPIADGAGDVNAHGQFSLMRTDKGVWVRGKLALRVRVVCSRCLNGYAQVLEFLMDEEYLPIVDINTGQTIHVPESAEGTFTIDHRHVLDLREALRQYTITHQPMKPLCTPECRGLCPICGSNRNDYRCSCQEGTIDRRWSPLLRLHEDGSR